MSPKKIIFFAVVGILSLGLVVAFFIMQGSTQQAPSGPRGPASLTVWLVGEDTGPWGTIASNFKAKYPKYAATNISFVKFAKYADYERVALSVLAEGRGPDILTVSSEGPDIFSGKTIDIPESYASGFSENFSSVVQDNVLIIEKSTDEEGNPIEIRSLKGIPMGYEAMGLFVNRSVARNLRAGSGLTWDRFEAAMAEVQTQGVIGLGGGLPQRYLPNASDVLTFYSVQGWATSVESLTQKGAVGIQNYLDSANGAPTTAFRPATTLDDSTSEFTDDAGTVRPTEIVTSRSVEKEMETWKLTLPDLMARGRLAALFGYPSFIKELEYAQKRAAGNARMNLVVMNVPQEAFAQEGIIPKNLARYQYLAISRSIPEEHGEAAAEFLSYLSTSDAQKAYLTAFPWMLPVRIDLMESTLDEAISTTLTSAKRRPFILTQGDEIVFESRLPNDYRESINQLLTEGRSAWEIGSLTAAYVACRSNQLFRSIQLDSSCSIGQTTTTNAQ